ncbi:MAG: elongator complex protein 3 [Oscillospiraceae bacterium]
MTPRRSIIPVFVPHLGCPHMCVFCNQRRISGKTAPADADTVRAALEEGLSRIYGDTETTLAFYGGSFTAIPAREQEELLGAALPFLRSGRISSLRLSTRPDCIDDVTLSRLKRYGVKTIELGVQSMCPDVLTASERGHTAEDAERAAKMVKAAGFELILQMMTGLPEDTPEKSKYTAERFIELKPDGVRIYPTVIIRDTELYDMWRGGLYKEHTVEDAVELCADLSEMFDTAGIPIIRLGLNPTDDLSGGDAVGGAYHPALGELVMSRRYLHREEKLLTESDRGKSVIFGVAKGRISAAIGQKRANAVSLCGRFGLKGVRVIETDIEDGGVIRL